MPAAASSPDRPRTGGEALAQQLVNSEVDTVFGVPGVQLDYFLDGIAQAAGRLNFISCRHEQGAGYMADGYARASGKAGVVTVVPGPGVLNASAALATAYACSSPVVCFAGQIAQWAIKKHIGLLHDVSDQDAVLRAVTKQLTSVTSTSDIPTAAHDALGHAQSGRPRPVAVELPDNLLKGPFDGRLVGSPLRVTRVAPTPEAVSKAAAMLEDAQHPVICAGWGAVTAATAEALGTLATRLRAPVVMSQNGRGAISDRHPWALTSLGGRRVLAQADLVLVVGSRGLRMDGSPLVSPTAQMILLNADELDLGEPRQPALSLHADARLGVEAILAESGRGRSQWQQPEMVGIRRWCSDQIATLGELAEYVAALRAGIADDGILVGELTQASYASRVAYPVYEPRTNITPGYQGTLGFGLPAAIGAKVARPERPVISISGDGGFTYAFQELLTAVQYQIPVIAVVFNDNAYGNVLRTQLEDFGGRTIGSRLHNPDFPTLAKAFGLPGLTADSPAALTDTLRGLTAISGPVLIEVPVGPFRDPGRLVRELKPAS